MKTNKCQRNSILGMILVLTMFFMTLVPAVHATWWNDTYLYRAEINITNPTSSSFTNFPVYLNINKSSLMLSDYGDLRFVDGSCSGTQTTELDFEIENYTTTNAYLWAELPTLDSTGSSICMYYNNSGVSSSQNAANTWNSDYGLVYHMDSNGIDSTSNGRTRVSDVGVPTQNNSFMGYGISGDGNDAWSQANLAYWEQQWSIRTHEVVFTTRGVTARQTILAEGGGTNGAMMYILSGKLYARWWSESNPNWGGDSVNVSILANTTYYAAMAFDENNNYTLYLNEVQSETKSSPDRIDAHSGDGGIFYTSGSKDFHDGSFSGQYFDGVIHEFRVSDIEQTKDESLMKYNNYLNYSNTISVGIEDELLPTVEITINSPSTSALVPIQQNATQLVNVTLTCVGNTAISCGRITSYIQYNNSPFTNISTISATTPFWTSDSQGLFCDLNGSDSCNFSWNVNATGTIGSNHLLRVFSSSNRTKISDNVSKNISVRIISGSFISFNQTSYTFPTFDRDSGSKTHNISAISNFGDHTNVDVSCESGDCSTITENWIDNSIVNDSTSKDFTFTCDDSTVGSFMATFNITSNEATEHSTIDVSCTVAKIYGPLNITIVEPLTQNVTIGQNQTFKLNSTISCTGECGNISAFAVYAGGAFGDGSDGNITISLANTQVNDYTYLTGNEGIGNTTLALNSAAAFSIGDEILIIQMQNGSGNGIAGQYEYRKITGKSGSTIDLNQGLGNSYYSGTFDVASAQATQVIRIPQYTNVTIASGASITAPAWNGFSGGIVIFRASEFINTTGYVNVSQKGFRGGSCNGCGNSAWGDQGESTLGIGSGVLTNNGIGGGGGYGPTGVSGEPGGGGGHATAGGDGTSTNTATGGTTIGTSNLSTIFFGGGAGGGGDNDGGTPFPEYTDGGGIAMLFAPNIYNANVISKGENGTGPGSIGGTSGGGAGGSIWLVARNLDVNDVNISGGIGFVDSDDTSGDGGLGRMRFDYDSKSGVNITPGYTGSLLEYVESISTTPGDKPLYSISSNTQSCIVLEDGSCSFEWVINATGDINTTTPIYVYTFSNYSQILAVTSYEINVSIVDNVVPTITLFEPTNNSKIIVTGPIDFIFRIDDDDSNVTCSLFIDGIFNTSKTCTTGINSSFTLNISSGLRTWFIQANDSFPNSINSTTWQFLGIGDYFFKFTKKILFENTNQYLVNILRENLANYTNVITGLDFVDTTFTYGSFNTLYNFTNITSGSMYNGDLLGWNLTISNGSTSQINHSISGVGDYNLDSAFILGGE